MSDENADLALKAAYQEYSVLRESLGSRAMFGENVSDFTDDIPKPKTHDKRVFKFETSITRKYSLLDFNLDKEWLDAACDKIGAHSMS